jgi:peptide/nickel transport system substrate-binding protein
MVFATRSIPGSADEPEPNRFPFLSDQEEYGTPMRRSIKVVALSAATSLLAAACGGGGGGGGTSGTSVKTTFQQGETKIVNPSTKQGGTLRFVNSSDVDSMDPGNMYYAHAWNFSRIYARPLVTFKSGPGPATLVPDLATSLGQHSADLRTWTYHLRPGIKYDDGTPVKAQDVKYAVARSNYTPDVLNKGPVYFNLYLDNPNHYKGPYKDKNLDDFKGVTTPDDTTVVFHLKVPFAEFDDLVSIPQTAPVPQAKDTGVNYQQHVVSTGPYKMDSYEPGKSATFSRNPNWDPATDPNRHQLPDKVVYQANVAADEVDNRVLNGQADVDMPGTGVQAAGRARILQDPNLKSRTDDPLTTFIWFIPINTQVKPLDNVACRQAIEYGVDKTLFQGAYGGPTGGDLASTALPPVIAGGEQKFDLYPTPGNKGDIAKAKQALQQCGQPNGFSTKMAFRADRPKEKAAAQATQQSLARVGIKLDLVSYPSNTYTSAQAGSPSFLKKNGIGLATYGWGADFPTGFGYLSQILDGAAIKAAGNSNVGSLSDPTINALFKKVVQEPDATKRAAIYAQISHQAMAQAAILPELYVKSLLYRPANLTNVYVIQGYDMYDYANLGVK